MAVVKMGQIKSTPGKALAYIARSEATRGGLFVSTNAAVIDPSDAAAVARAMGETSRRVGRTEPREGSVLAHHVIQSFDPSETVDPEVAHRIGRELAERITAGQHEYMVATHLDKDHVHNHIIFNAVNLETGRKFRCQKSTIGQIRGASDELCLAQGLSVLPPKERDTVTRGFGEIYTTIKGKSHLHRIRTEVDKCIQVARSWDQFEGTLREAGIEVARSRGQLTFRSEDAPRAVRAWRLGAPYEETALASRLARSAVNRFDVDRTLITSVTDSAVVVKLPGTKGRYRVTVPKEQIIQHGRTLRCYVPSGSDIVVSNGTGRYEQSVHPSDLYRWFSVPGESLARSGRGAYRPLVGSVNYSELRTWRQAATAMHQLGDRINARATWAPDSHMGSGLERANGRLAEVRSDFTARLVALTEALDQPSASQSVRQLGVMASELRTLNRELERLKRDVAVLTALSNGAEEVGLKERIQKRAGEIAGEEGIKYGPNQEKRRQKKRNRTEDADRQVDRVDMEREQRAAMNVADRIQQRVQELKRMKREQQPGSEEGPTWRR